MNTHFQQIASKSLNADCHPMIIKSRDDAAIVVGWIRELGIEEVNGAKIELSMEWTPNQKNVEYTAGNKISLGEWVWQERRRVNDYVRSILKVMHQMKTEVGDWRYD